MNRGPFVLQPAVKGGKILELHRIRLNQEVDPEP
jgi:hypothetical protein